MVVRRLINVARADASGGNEAKRKEDEKLKRENQKGTKNQMQATYQNICETK